MPEPMRARRRRRIASYGAKYTPRSREMIPVASAFRRNLFLFAVALLLSPAMAVAHDIPASVVVQAFVRPSGNTLRLLVRVPMASMRDVDFPLRGDGLLDLAKADATLKNAAMLWLAKD